MYRKDAPRTADRSLPRKSLVMVAYPDEIDQLPEPVLPYGYRFRLYHAGDAQNWAELMAAVEEYQSVSDGLNSFCQQFLPEEKALMERQVYIVAPDGTTAGTSMAWWFEEHSRRYGRLHWVAAHPDHQGQGLGRAAVTWGMRRTLELEGRRNVYLDTQTWSHKAIGLYLRLGFCPVRKTHPVLRGVNEYDEALEILRDVLSPETLELFLARSVD